MNNFNFTEVNYSFLQFFKTYAGPGSLVLCYEKLYPEYSNRNSTRCEWSAHMEKVFELDMKVEAKVFLWRVNDKELTVFVYRKL